LTPNEISHVQEARSNFVDVTQLLILNVNLLAVVNGH